MSGWGALLPEWALTAGLAAVLVADLFLPRARKAWLPALALLATAATLAALWTMTPGQTFGAAFTADGLSVYLKSLILLGLALVIFCSWDFEAVWSRPQGEYLFLLMSATLGMMFIASGTELVLLYIGLELATFPQVLLVAYRPADAKSAEGGLKYLMLAALGSAILLFGFSLIYAVTGVTQAGQLAAVLAKQGSSPLFILGMLLAIAGIGFKIALVPFHLWAPDAYEGAPTPVTAFLSVASKTAGFALALRFLAGALPGLRPQWAQTLAMLSALTMCLGNFAAIPQTNLKRMLAYSSIAQAGYMVMGLVAYETLGLSSLLYYLAAYLFTNVGAFVVVMAVERTSGSSDLSAFTGLAQRSPRLALAMLLALLSLAGIPPLAGFAAKFYLFAAAYGQGYGWLVVIGVLNSALSLYYYLRVVRVMYILPPAAAATAIPRLPLALTAALLICMAGILVLGVYPGPFVSLARAALLP
jgi:NADH-quinone oxidoreductase subunit N